MFELKTEPGKPFLVVKITGAVRAGDYVEEMAKLNRLVAETRPRGLMIDWTDLEGWDEEADSLRFSVLLELRSKFKRMAILADRGLEAEISRFQVIVDLPVRRYSPSDRRSAVDWLESEADLPASFMSE